jgi:predicted nucleic acid-binding protein
VILVDTSSWIHFLRPGGDRDKKVLRDFERLLPDLPIDAQVWQLSLDLAKKVRNTGVTVPPTDLLIAACARRHQVRLEHADSDFKLLAKIE